MQEAGSKLEEKSFDRLFWLSAAGVLATAGAVLGTVWFLTRSYAAVFSATAAFAAAFAWGCLLAGLYRRKLAMFTDRLCHMLDEMMEGEKAAGKERQLSGGGEGEWMEMEEETLLSRIGHRLYRLYEVMEDNRRRAAEEKKDIQSLLSDISHQVKTPVANLRMVTATLLDHEVSGERLKQFLLAVESQVNKLDFLMNAMIKTSRLETGLIQLKCRKASLYETLASALGEILFAAEKKGLCVNVECPEELEAVHDGKWTAEALFNLLDNALKYTPENGRIDVKAFEQEMYVRIDVADTGRGIPEYHQAEIFRRFYREKQVHDIEGIGVGLYLAREIITLQAGYLTVYSVPGEGSVFTVYLPR